MFLKLLGTADVIIPAGVVGFSLLAPSLFPLKIHEEKVKRVCLFRLAKAGSASGVDELEALKGTVDKFNDMDGIKATFHATDPALAQHEQEYKRHTHCLLILASSRDALTDLTSSDEHKVTFAKQLLAAGNSKKDMTVHDSPLSVIRC